MKYYRSGVQPFHHPMAGDLTLNYDALEIPADPGLTIVAYAAEPGSPSQQALDLLASWTSTPADAVGQTLYVTEGKGLVQSRDGDAEEIRAGDIVCTPAAEWHWHGAAPDHFMTHLSITEAVPGDERPEADWGEHVTDDEYNQR